jgi:hypothetical protein
MTYLMQKFGPIIAGILRCLEALCVTEAVFASRAGLVWLTIGYGVGAAVAAFFLWETYRHIKPHIFKDEL